MNTLLDKLVDKIRVQASQKSFQDTEAFAWGDYPDDKDDVYSNGVDDGYIGFAKELLKIIEDHELTQHEEPVATVHYPRTGGNVGLSWRAIPEMGAMPQDGAKLYLAPQSQQMREYGRARERAAYERAMEACMITCAKNHADAATFRSVTKAYVAGCDDCYDAIRALGADK